MRVADINERPIAGLPPASMPVCVPLGQGLRVLERDEVNVSQSVRDAVNAGNSIGSILAEHSAAVLSTLTKQLPMVELGCKIVRAGALLNQKFA